jgi:DNA modification methylase
MAESVTAAREKSGDHDNPFGDSRNKCSVWTIPTQPYPEAHFATFPEALVEPCIKAGFPAGGVVLDPFCGSGTVGLVARRLSCDFVGIELNPEYVKLAEKRLAQQTLQLHAT